MPNAIGALLSAAPDSLSSSRAVKMVWFAAVTAVWCWVSVMDHHLAELPDSVIWVSGILFGGSLVQKRIEQSGCSTGQAQQPGA